MDIEKLQRMDFVPHTKALGVRIVEMGEGVAVLCLPYSDHLVGDPDTGIIHGGAITALLDNASGTAVHTTMKTMTSIATLDLRIDYMRPATPQRPVFARAECFRKTSNIAFVRGSAYHDSPDDPIATTIATFVLSSNQSRKVFAAGGEDR